MDRLNNRCLVLVALWVTGISYGFSAQPKKSVDELIASLSDANLRTADDIAKKIAEHGSSATERLLAAIDSDDFAIQRGAFFALQYLGPKAEKSVPTLHKLVGSSNSVKRRGAIYVLGAIGPASKPAVADLILALDHEDFHTQYAACRALGRLGEASKPAIPELISLTKKGVTSVRRNAAAALGNLGPIIGEEGLNALVDTFTDRSQPVRDEAVIAVGKLSTLAKPVVPKLEELIKNEGLKSRPLAIQSIMQLTGNTTQGIARLVDELDNAQTQFLAAAILGEMGTKARPAIPALVAMSKSVDPDCRIDATRALIRIAPNDKEVEIALKRLRKDPDEYVREIAHEMRLKNVGEK